MSSVDSITCGCAWDEAADELAVFLLTCPCSLLASPAHLLDCWSISLRKLYEEQGLMCETMMRKGQIGLRVGFPAPRGLETITDIKKIHWGSNPFVTTDTLYMN
ncbi:hypothetical protein TNCV_3383611 [Trichonephila clavipes]|uniref:Uncharacterized protein n=1 Tax=Trichonephila clavipes TaxID=2585209 RepID=A0A8X6T3L5_TRICX|nr:hypothetical protein TNCV_3383611 [Trichonephila clavipes]